MEATKKINDREYLTNAFWEKEDRSRVKCIRLIKRPEGGRKRQVLAFDKYNPNGVPNSQYEEVVTLLGIELIDRNTQERNIKKEKENREKAAVNEQKKKSKELEHLFNLKLQAFEIEEIKNSTERSLRSRMRRAKNVMELHALTALLIGVELGYFKKVENDESESTN